MYCPDLKRSLQGSYLLFYLGAALLKTWIDCYRRSICAVWHWATLFSYVNMRINSRPQYICIKTIHGPLLLSQRGTWYNSKRSCEAVQRGARVYSAPRITLPPKQHPELKPFSFGVWKIAGAIGLHSPTEVSHANWEEGRRPREHGVHNVSSACPLRGEDPLPTEDRPRQTRTGPDVRAQFCWVLKQKMCRSLMEESFENR